MQVKGTAKITVGKSVAECLRELCPSAHSIFPEGTRVDTPGKITLTLYSRALGKPRMTQRDKWAQRPEVMRYRAWRDALRSIAGQMPPVEQVDSLSWTAVFSPPASWSKKKRAAAMGTLHRVKPDRDNIDKAILDSLWEKDQAIAAGTLLKIWGERDSLTIEIVLSAAASGG